MSEYLTPVERKKTHDEFQKMFGWGFSVFREYLAYFDAPQVPKIVLTILSNKNFELISAAMAAPRREFSADETAELIRLGSMYLAKERALAVIMELVAESVLIRKEELPSGERYGDIQIQLDNMIQNGDLPFRIEGSQIEFDGLSVAAENMVGTFYALYFAIEEHSKLRIKNLPIDLKAAEIVQALMHCHLTSIAFENCWFRFSYQSEFQFDFSELEKLIEFECTNCISKDFLPMLESIKSKHLTKLTIADCSMDDEEQERFMEFLMNHSKLEFLKFVSNSEYVQMPNVTGQVLDLENLKHLDLTGIADVESFAQSLQECQSLNKLVHLNLMGCSFSLSSADLLFNNLHKISNLQFLGIQYDGYYFKDLADHIHKLKNLKQLVFDSACYFEDLHQLPDVIMRLNRGTVISSTKDMFSLTNATMLPYFKNVDCSELDLATISEVSHNLNFDAVARLKLLLGIFFGDGSDPNEYADFFNRFHKLEFLSVEITPVCNLNYFKALIANNSIATLELKILHSFTRWKELCEIIQDCNLSAIYLNGDDLNFEEAQFFFANVLNARFWVNVRHLEIQRFPLASAFIVLEMVEMPKLQSLAVAVREWSGEDFILRTLPTVQRLAITIAVSPEAESVTLVKFLRCFPKLTALHVDVPSGTLCNFDPTKLFANLRELEIGCRQIEHLKTFISNLQRLPLLYPFTLENDDDKLKIEMEKYYEIEEPIDLSTLNDDDDASAVCGQSFV